MWIITTFLTHVKEFIQEAIKKQEVWLLLFIFGLLGVFVVSLDIDILALILAFLKYTWWLWTLLILWPIFMSTWFYWRQQLYQNAIKWSMLELRIPREILKTQAAMEQIIRAIHSQRNAPGNFQERYIDGEVTRWYSLEMVSFGGEIHFYIRCYFKQKEIIKAAFFSYYPDVEISDVDDYIERLPTDMKEMNEQGMDIFGSEMVLVKPEAYPIKTYPYFESPDEEKVVDPISAFIEILGNIKKEDIVGIQISIAPKGADWVMKYKPLVDEIKKPTLIPKSEDQLMPVMRTRGETDTLEAVEKNLSKPAFDVLARFIYVAPKSTFYADFARRGIAGAFNQYSMINLNSFVHNYGVITRAQVWDWPFFFISKRVAYRRQRILLNYRSREMPPETWMGKFISSFWPYNSNFPSRTFDMNVEGIATLFHPPTKFVLTAPHMSRIEAKKAGPPGGLAIFGGEEEVEKYLQ